MWYVYLLYNDRIKRTYIGCTTNPLRRIRQHNRELKGGAKATAKGSPNWIMTVYLAGFENRSIAMRWEKLLKLRARGFEKRCTAFKELTFGICPGKGKQYPVPKGLIDYWLPFNRSETYT